MAGDPIEIFEALRLALRSCDCNLPLYVLFANAMDGFAIQKAISDKYGGPVQDDPPVIEEGGQRYQEIEIARIRIRWLI